VISGIVLSAGLGFTVYVCIGNVVREHDISVCRLHGYDRTVAIDSRSFHQYCVDAEGRLVELHR